MSIVHDVYFLLSLTMADLQFLERYLNTVAPT